MKCPLCDKFMVAEDEDTFACAACDLTMIEARDGDEFAFECENCDASFSLSFEDLSNPEFSFKCKDCGTELVSAEEDKLFLDSDEENLTKNGQYIQ